uniref:Pentatricopeptide repeat-containing protein n=1 Tax=Rhizophora mucronata TaxID=61149 RepID=A0A2P2K6D3_RHIMU
MEITIATASHHPRILAHPKQTPTLFLSSTTPVTEATRATKLRRISATTSTAVKLPVKEPPAELPPPLSSPPSVVVVGRRRPHSKSYLDRQAAILEVGQSPDLNSALQRLGGSLKVQDFNVILRNLGKQERWQYLTQLFDWMREHNKISASSYSSYIKFVGKGLNPAKVLEIYNNIPDESMKANVFICNSVLSCLVRNGKFDVSIKLFYDMKRAGLTPDAITYSTLLAGCIKVKKGYFNALDLVQELKYNGLVMDSVMYGTLVAICASSHQCEEAQNYFDQMKNEGHLPNSYHYSSLLNAYSSSGNYKKAEELVQDMKSSGLVPNKVIFTTLLKVYVRGHMFEKSRELLAELEALGYAEDEMPYCILMNGLAKTGHMDEARALFDEMTKKNIRSDGYSHSIMISAFCRSGLLEEAKQLAREFEAKYEKYDLVILNTMLCAYCKAGEMESVMQMMKKMDELAISPDHTTFHILIKYFCKEKLYLLAYKIMQDMRRKGHQPAEELCSTLIFHLSKIKAYSEAFDVYSELKYCKRTICKALHEKILHILIAGHLLKEAYVVVKDNVESISRPAINKFANAYMASGNINMVNDVLKFIHGSGLKIDQVSNNELR